MRAFIALTLAVTVAAPAAATAAAKTLTVSRPWTRPAMQGGTAAGYLTIANTGAAPDVLLSVESPAAKSASIHRSMTTDGMATMRAMSNGLAVPARGIVTLSPGGDHIMLSGLTKALSQGQKIPVTLVFQRAGRVKVDLVVDALGPSSQPVAPRDHH